MHEKPETNIVLNETWNTFFLRTGISQGCLLLPLLFCIVLKVPANAVKEEKSIKLGKE